MGYACHEGRAWAINQMLRFDPEPIFFLDLGAGAGGWMEAVKPWFLHSKWLAIEAWAPYIERFMLRERYSLVSQDDIRESPFPESDVVLAGDVLEHMEIEEAIKVWERAKEAARQAVFLSIPITHYPQGAISGNPYQVHVHEDWTHAQVMDTLPGITTYNLGTITGTYMARS